MVSHDTSDPFLPDRPRSGWTTVIALGLASLLGLFLAAGSQAHYWTGLSVAVISLLLIMRTMKGIFDRLDRESNALGGPQE